MFSSFGATCFGSRFGSGNFGGDRFYSGGMMGLGWAGLIVRGLISLLILALVITLIVMLIRNSNRNRNTLGSTQYPVTPSGSTAIGKTGDDANALRLLNERYARGEIGEEEYKVIKKNLTE